MWLYYQIAQATWGLYFIIVDSVSAAGTEKSPPLQYRSLAVFS